jgi:hypothetical protein
MVDKDDGGFVLDCESYFVELKRKLEAYIDTLED